MIARAMKYIMCNVYVDMLIIKRLKLEGFQMQKHNTSPGRCREDHFKKEKHAYRCSSWQRGRRRQRWELKQAIQNQKKREGNECSGM